MSRQNCLSKVQKARRVVLKVGSSLLTSREQEGGVNRAMIYRIREEIGFLKSRGMDVLLVSSGAVSMGREVIRGFGRTPVTDPTIARKQALSAIGQSRLINAYREAFAEIQTPVAQLLITARDFRDRRTYLNIGHTLQELISMGVVPIVNENDTVSTEELRFGDNDLLSASCASLFRADLLVILTTVEGFLVEKKRVSFLDSIGEEEMALAGGPTGPGSGGMQTKLRAAQLCAMTGEITAILPGTVESPVRALFEGEDIGTLVCGKKRKKLSAKKRWLLYGRPRGEIVIDPGAREALLERGSSLLPAGIQKVSGNFLAGDVIEILGDGGRSLGRGLANYSAKELQPVLGMSGEQIRESHHLTGSPVVIHRDNMILEL